MPRYAKGYASTTLTQIIKKGYAKGYAPYIYMLWETLTRKTDLEPGGHFPQAAIWCCASYR